ncbi:hypothetical protein ACK8P5_26695 (plasmid) [Paenibacillus sp. EC2-1]|uniref:hypothetical protein n=1 Tax=Paenibacillus sp. EC2-1 TaxID=3388665 RepID=UPI003BEEEA6E
MRYPEMVKRNARYRGPMESEKETSQILDIGRSIDILRSEYKDLKASMSSLFSSISQEYHVDQPQPVDHIRRSAQSTRGGEL